MKFGLIVLLMTYSLACGGHVPSTMRRLSVKAEVVYVYRDAQRVVIRHDVVPGWAPAGVTELSVRDEGDYRRLRPGHRITATLVINVPLEYLETIKIVDAKSE